MKKTIKDFDLNNKKVIIRVDFNVPIKDKEIVDDTRIKESLETINYALKEGAKVILLSHLGRIKTEEDKNKNTLMYVGQRLSDLLGKNVKFIKSIDFDLIKENINNMNIGDVVLLENTRFYDLDNKMESSNDQKLASFYASLGDIFINDAFGTIHRAHASNVGIASILPSGIGFLVEKELKKLEELNNPIPEYTVILGGAKVSDKIGVIENLIKKCDHIIIGGKMANTFLKVDGYSIGKSEIEEEYVDFCRNIIDNYRQKVILPIDVVVSTDVDSDSYHETSSVNEDEIILDIGPKTVELIKENLLKTNTVFWNGPLGYYEKEAYQTGTKAVLEYLINNNIKTILGGGDIVAASSKLELKEKVYHASTGGGATLEYLEGKELPGLKVIEDKE